MTLILRPRCDLEPHPAAVVGEAPAVAERVDQEEAAAALFGGAPTIQLVVMDPGSRVRNLATHSAAARVDRDLDRTSRTVANRVCHELGDDHLHAPAIGGANTRLLGGLANGFTSTRRRMQRGRQLQGN